MAISPAGHQLPLEFDPQARDSSGLPQLLWVMQNGSDEEVQALIDAKADIEARSIRPHGALDNHTSLMIAVRLDLERAVRRLVNARADLEAKSHSYTPLLLCAAPALLANYSIEKGTRIAKTLIDARANLEAKDVYGRTPLMEAVSRQMGNIVQLLIDERADIEARDRRGLTPLRFIMDKPGYEATQILMKEGADLEALDNNGHPVLMSAAFSISGRSDIIKILASAKVNINAHVHNKTVIERLLSPPTSFPFLAKHRPGVIQALVDSRADLGVNTSSRHSLLKKASLWREDTRFAEFASDLEKILIRGGADSGPLLLQAAKDGDVDAVKNLVRLGGNLKAKAPDGMNLLSVAVVNDQYEIVRFLACAGLNAGEEDSSGNTPLGLAAQMKKHKIVQLLDVITVDLRRLKEAIASIFVKIEGFSTFKKAKGAIFQHAYAPLSVILEYVRLPVPPPTKV